jgi:ribonuclease HI
MSESSFAVVHIDGASRGNPGPAAYAFVIRRDGGELIEECDTLGKTTNNIAEYTALIRALERAAEIGVKRLAVRSDSELMVKQMTGEYRVKNADLKDLYAEAKELTKKFEEVAISHVRREENKDADRLCNEALDGRPRRAGASPTEPMRDAMPSPRREPVSFSAPVMAPMSAPPESLDMEVIAILNAVEKSWRAGKPSPTPHELWERLWVILGEHGVLLRSTSANRS